MSTFDINVSVFIFYLDHQSKLPPRVQRIVICKILTVTYPDVFTVCVCLVNYWGACLRIEMCGQDTW